VQLHLGSISFDSWVDSSWEWNFHQITFESRWFHGFQQQSIKQRNGRNSIRMLHDPNHTMATRTVKLVCYVLVCSNYAVIKSKLILMNLGTTFNSWLDSIF